MKNSFTTEERRQRLLLTALLFYMISLIGLGVGMIGPSLITLARQTDSSIKQINLLFILMPFGFLSGVYLCRYLLEKRGIHTWTFLTFLAGAVCLVSAAFTPSATLLFAALFMLAVGQGMLEIIANLVLLKTYKKNPTPYMNAMHFFFGVGAIVAPVVVGWNIQRFANIQYAYLIFAALYLFGVGLLLRVRIEPVLSDEKEHVSFSLHSKRFPILIAIHIFCFLYLVLEAGYSVWIYPFLTEGGFMNAVEGGVFVSAFWFLFTGFRLIGAFLSVRYNAAPIMFFHLFLVLLGFLALIVFGPSLPLLWTVNFLVGAGLSVCFPCMLSYCETGFRIPGKTIGHFFASMAMGAAVGTFSLGYLFSYNPFSVFYPLLLASVAILAVLFYLTRLAKHTG